MKIETGYDYYNHGCSGWFSRFVKQNPEFATPLFREYVVKYNRGDRDSGELQDVAHHEILRLAAEFSERIWRENNLYGPYPMAAESPMKLGDENF
jgi:hypothetical protein